MAGGDPSGAPGAEIVERAELRDRARVFGDRREAGEVLAGMLPDRRAGAALVLAIPAGGVPVAVAAAARLGLPVDAAAVSKITPPWSTEVGYGAVAFDGTVRLNEPLLPRMGLSRQEIAAGVARTTEKVRRRAETLRAGRGPLDVGGREAVLVDDGLASGFTMTVAVDAVRKAGAARVVVAVPTAHDSAARRLVRRADAVYCANLRAGMRFAVADAYRNWRDVGEEEARRLLEAAWRSGPLPGS